MQEKQIQQIRQQVIRYFRKHCAGQEVDDLVQECLLRVLMAEARGLNVKPELVNHICHAVWVDWVRRQNRRCEVEVPIEDTQDCNCVSWEAQAVLSIDIEASLRALTASERDLVRRYYFNEETCASIGAQLGISEQAVKKRLQRLKEKLRRLLVSYGGGT